MSRYDRAITIFSPDGHLFQVEYAQEAVKKGSAAVGVRGDKILVLAVEKRAVSKLQDPRTIRKICRLDDHIVIAFAGLTADARILIDWAREECQDHRLVLEDPITVENLARYVANVQQRHTQSTGVRPFGLSTLVAGFNEDGSPHLYTTDPAGVYMAWKANAVGRSDKTVLEYLEKNYTEDIAADNKLCVKLAIRALQEVVQSGAQNMELVVLEYGKPMTPLSMDELEALVKEVEEDREKTEKTKKDTLSTAKP